MQEVSLTFFELGDHDKPKSEIDFEIWAYYLALKIMRRALVERGKLISENIKIRGKDGAFEVTLIDWLKSGSVHHRVYPVQLTHVEAQDALRMISALPDDMQRKIIAVIEGGDVVGYAADTNVSLFDAMKDLRHIRVVMNRLAQDLADGKKFDGDEP